MSKNVLGLVSLSLGTLLATGCESADSTDIRTSGIYATYTAVSDGTGTRAESVMRVGGPNSNTFLQFKGGDKVTVTAGTETVTLAEQHVLDFYYYNAEMVADDDGQSFVFNFTRTAADESAPSSTATLPNAFAVSAPAANAILSRAAANTVTWAASGTTDTMAVTVAGDCVRTLKKNVSGDPGTFVFNAAEIVANSGKESDTCAGTITVTRTRAGTIDPAFEGGSATAAQSRVVDVRFAP